MENLTNRSNLCIEPFQLSLSNSDLNKIKCPLDI